MTGGTYMYIHGYQIHNVLNVYRKQLSHGPEAIKSQTVRTSDAKAHIEISPDDQRRSLMDKISTEIVERITQTGPGNQFEKILANQLGYKSQQSAEMPTETALDFKYTVIDENNRKITNSLTIRGCSLNSRDPEVKAGNNIGNNPNSKAQS
jgi:hypothetical protein